MRPILQYGVSCGGLHRDILETNGIFLTLNLAVFVASFYRFGLESGLYFNLDLCL